MDFDRVLFTFEHNANVDYRADRQTSTSIRRAGNRRPMIGRSLK